MSQDSRIPCSNHYTISSPAFQICQELLLCQGVPVTEEAARSAGFKSGIPIPFQNVQILDSIVTSNVGWYRPGNNVVTMATYYYSVGVHATKIKQV